MSFAPFNRSHHQDLLVARCSSNLSSISGTQEKQKTCAFALCNAGVWEGKSKKTHGNHKRCNVKLTTMLKLNPTKTEAGARYPAHENERVTPQFLLAVAGWVTDR